VKNAKFFLEVFSRKNNKRILIIWAVIIVVIIGISLMILNSGGVNNVTRDDLSDQERALFDLPSEDAPDEEHLAYFRRARASAREAEFVDLNTCKIATPFVLQLAEGDTIRVRNLDKVDHVISHNPEHILFVPSDTTVEVPADFGTGPGLYAYGCDGSDDFIGFFLILEDSENDDEIEADSGEDGDISPTDNFFEQ